jgi:hypothetical protein
MTYRFARTRGLLVGTLLLIAPILHIMVAGGIAGLLHLVVAMTGIVLLAVALSPTEVPRSGYERYDPS